VSSPRAQNWFQETGIGIVHSVGAWSAAPRTLPKAVVLDFQYFDCGLCVKNSFLQVSTAALDSVSKKTVEMNWKLERSHEDLNLTNQRFEESQSEQPRFAVDKCYFAQKSCDVFMLSGGLRPNCCIDSSIGRAWDAQGRAQKGSAGGEVA
jgi:hypothetical protein